MAFNNKQFRDLIKRVLTEAGYYSKEAEDLLCLTAAVESNYGTYLRQTNGPALGVFQMEPKSYDEVFRYVARTDKSIGVNIRGTMMEHSSVTHDMETNLEHQILMARAFYMRFPEPLPCKDGFPHDEYLWKLANYYKVKWNTYLGKSTVQKAVIKYNQYCRE